MQVMEYIDTDLKNALSDIRDQVQPNRLFIVTGKQSFANTGAQRICQEVFYTEAITIFNDFSVNPKLEDITKGIQSFRTAKPDLVLAVGGGSTIDMAKAIVGLASTKNPEQYVRGEKKLESVDAPLIAVPTTPGTGSEATHFAVVYINGVKYSLAHPLLLPDYVIIDPLLTHSLSPYQTAVSGLDALVQGIESLWSVGATEESRQAALEAVVLAHIHLIKAVHSPNPEARRGMSLAAYASGRAINVSKTTLCHALSYPLTTHFKIPHGHAVALTLPATLSLLAHAPAQSITHPAGQAHIHATLEQLAEVFGGTVEELPQKVKAFVTELDLPMSLSVCGVTQADTSKILAEASPERMSNFPVHVNEVDLHTILTNSM